MPRPTEQRRPSRPPARRPKNERPGRRPPPEDALRIVFEDPDLLVVDKPPGLLSATPPGSRDPSVFNLVRNRARRQGAPAPGAWIIHRLDREASGLMVFARSERAFNWLKEDFRARRVRRTYLALGEGEVPRQKDGLPSGSVQSFLREDRLGLVRSIPASRGGPDAPLQREDLAKLAVTYWKALATGNGRTLFELHMESGRKHQIRVHLKDLGHPITGDERYGARTNPAGRLTLHATELGFRHPGTGEDLRFHSPVPKRWWEAAHGMPPVDAPQATPSRAFDERPEVLDERLDTSWDRVATWYDTLVDEKKSDHYSMVVVPGTMRLLSPKPGERILDVACGQGDLCRRLAAQGHDAVGVDASPKLIETARERSGTALRFEVGDARSLDALDLGSFDAVTCVMALMNIDPLDPVLSGIARKLRAGGKLVGVILHPSFRAPRQTSWADDRSVRPHLRYRRVDGYLSPGQYEIVMNPGEVAKGRSPITTWTFHRPLQAYVKALSDAGFVVDALEEWPSARPPHGTKLSQEENRVKKEIPLFLAFRARLAPAR